MTNINIEINKEKPAVAAALVAQYLSDKKENVTWKFGKSNGIIVEGGNSFSNSATLGRFLARSFPAHGLYGTDILQKTEIDHWLNFAYRKLACTTNYSNAVNCLDQLLQPVTFIVRGALTLADFGLWEVLHTSCQWQTAVAGGEAPPNVLRYFTFLSTQKPFDGLKSTFQAAAVKEEKKRTNEVSIKKDEGKFVELPGAEMGKVVVRFPPEASGYLHVGHAKAALLNQHYRDTFKGTLIMRFDDTNPAKEDGEFEKIILEDLKLLGVNYDVFSHTSDHFDSLLKYCEKMIETRNAYVDDTPPEQMKKEREERVESKNRNNDVKTNMKLWAEMKKGSERGQTCAVRAKIDMNCNNGCMRDPTMYRCKNETHVRTGDKYKVYPTYDFACPIVDSVEGVTHALRTTEYHDRDDQYFWFLDTLGLRKPHIYEYSRLNLQNTVMSKRKLTWIVNEGYVDGWDDPRFPTVRGVLRRGMTVEGLKQFIITQGSSRSVNMMEWDKIWSYNKKVIDPVVHRHTALSKEGLIEVTVTGAKIESKKVDNHPKNKEVGTKTVWYGPKIFLEGADAHLINQGEVVTLINWGNLKISKINKDKEGKVVSITADLDLQNTDYKKTQKFTWLADVSESPCIPVVGVFYDHIVSKGVLAKDEDFKQYLNLHSKKEECMLGDPCLASLKKGDIIQLQRKGFFVCDQSYEPVSPHTGLDSPCVLLYIPDGHQKEQQKGGPKNKDTPKDSSAKEKAQSKKGKVAEKSPQVEESPIVGDSGDMATLNDKIVTQGDLIRKIKSEKAAKDVITAQVDILKSLKTEFKSKTGKEWKPGMELSQAAPSPAAATAPQGDNGANQLNEAIVAQGNKIRELKASKADKSVITAEVETLKLLKTEFKSKTGKEWKPGMELSQTAPSPATATAPQGDNGATQLNEAIVAQGNKVRELKASKADKGVITAEVDTLKSLKTEFKSKTGKEWKPGMELSQGTPSKGGAELVDAIVAQGQKVNQLKTSKADKGQINGEEKKLTALKKEYKSVTGADWKESQQPSAEPGAMASSVDSPDALALKAKIDEQGDAVRKLKTAGGDKGVIDAEVKKLIALKDDYKALTGQAVAAPGGRGDKKEKKGEKKGGKEKKPAGGAEKKAAGDKKDDSKREVKKVTRLGLEASKEENLSDWYSQVITKSELIEYYDVSGCYILRPWAYSIWELIKQRFDGRIKKMGVENCYFPMFVSKSALDKEKTHIEDFAPEVAWVTKSGQSELAEPIAIRPTSETVMYPSYAKWIKSHRDLPLRLNQWCNVVRWEFKHPQPFLRTREFLWQEGHTAWAKKECAEEEVYAILEQYALVYEELLAIPVVRGRKTEKEKFAGGDFTTTVEAYISASGRAIQGATSHHLGQNFSKMFEIVFEDPDTQQKKYVYQNSWGITTRTIGVLAMVHGDNTGLVLPPRIASLQVVIVPCGVTAQMAEADANTLYDKCQNLCEHLIGNDVRAKADTRQNYSPGWKFNHWELKGVPLRVELGPRDLSQKQVVAVRRDNGDKKTLAMDDDLSTSIKELLDEIQDALYTKAKKEMDENLIVSHDWEEFCNSLDQKKLIQAPFCGEIPCEDKIKKDSARDAVVEEGAPAMGAKGLCIPFKQPKTLASGTACICPGCPHPAKFYTMFGRSY